MMKSIPSKRLCGIRFTNLSTEEISSLSVKVITNPQTFDSLLHPSYGGLYDPALGPADRDDVCSTCSLNFLHCPGHFGHISLPLPVYNPLFFKLLVQILKGSCLNCHHLLADRISLLLVKAQLQCLEYGLLSVVDDLENIVRENCTSEEGASTSQMVALISRELQKHVDKVTQDLNKTEASRSANVRNIAECKRQLITTFRREHIKHRAKCRLCKKRVVELRAEHNSKIYFKKRSKKSAVKRASFEKIVQQNQGSGTQKEQTPNASEPSNATNTEAETETAEMADQVYLTPQDAREHMKLIIKNEGAVLRQLFGALASDDVQEYPKSLDVFFLEMIPVPPSRFRPISSLGEKQFENPQTANLNNVLTGSIVLGQLLQIMKREDPTQTEVEADTNSITEEIEASVLARVPGRSKVEKLHNSWIHLQTRVNCLVDSDLDRLTTVDKHPGIRQLLEKKEGLFRKHMMGKRVNYAARSVISPDPNIATDEIGIPEIIATKLTYPQPVTPWNVSELRQAVINGPNIHPGALIVENEDGSKTMLRAGNATQREAIAKQLLTPNTTSGIAGLKKVHRHVKNGDILLLNRQPTLHKPSIMAHKARVLPGEKTLRLHYANCKSYNADFDGDEMNVHFPQNELGRAEAYDIMTTNNQYLVPKDSTPLSGLIQDHMVAGVRITMRGRFFNRQDYQHLVYSALTDKQGPVLLLPPAIRKPCTLWSGKQVFSTLLLNIIPHNKEPLNFTGRAKITSKHWQTHKPRPYAAGGTALVEDDMSESEVIVRHGELLCGVLDKAHYGPTRYGLVHCCYELYGGKVSGHLLTCLGRLFTSFLQTVSGFTLGVEDILCTEKADRKRRKLLYKAGGCGAAVTAKALGVEDATDTAALLTRLEDAHRSADGNDMREIDLCMKSKTDEVTNNVNNVCIPKGLQKKFPDNNLQLMVQAGAKGSQVNCMQISCLLGQIELEGRRPPLMTTGRSLPSFLPYDTSPRAGGFVDGRFLTGIRPQEYFFHCMAGREGLVDTAVKTSRSGYLQRCLIKHIEGLVVGYDLTVRDSDGSIVQFQYGEDALDILKTPFLKEKQFPFMIANHSAAVDEKQMEQITQRLATNQAKEIRRKIKKWEKRNAGHEGNKTLSPFVYYSHKKASEAASQLADTEMNEMELKSKTKEKLIEMWRETSDRHKYTKHSMRCPDPGLSQLQPDLHFGNTSEQFSKMVESYIGSNPHHLLSDKDDEASEKLSADRFRNLMNMKYLTSLCQPGEAVGLLAAQSIGEPSTQMTLNTFHFAGRGEMNVTLGIPRLREILMVASKNIKTPSMSIPVLPSHKAHSRAKRLKKKLTRMYLSEVLEDVNVSEVYEVKGSGMKYRTYTIKMSFLPQDCYKEDVYLTPEDVMHYVEKKFIKRLVSATNQKIRQIIDTRIVDSKTRASVMNDDLEDAVEVRPHVVNRDEDENSEDEDEDSDAVARKRRQQRMDDMEYEEEGDEEEEGGEEEEDEMEQSDGEGKKTPSIEEDGEGEAEREEGASSLSTKKKKSKNKKKNEKEGIEDEVRLSTVYAISDLIFDYKYDTVDDLWCKVSLRLDIVDSKLDMCSVVENEARRAVVLQMPGITRCFLADNTVVDDPSDKILQIEGVNIMEMFHYDRILDLRRLYSNDIHAIAETYGIEAARRVIIKEIQEVFKAYGIHVDSRHLTLVADYMTFDGAYKPFNRFSLESNSSPLQKMSFEQSMTFLKQATVDGACDQLKSPSARLAVGRVVTGGTGSFDLIQPLR